MISAVILTKNNEKTIKNVLDSLKFLSEVLILDTGSKDQTCKIAASFPNTKIHQTPFTNFGSLRNQGADLAKNPWILSIDSDEVLSPLLQKEIQTTSLNLHTVYGVVRENFFQGKKVTFCGWKSEKRLRLYHKEQTHFSTAHVHEEVVKKSLNIHYFQGVLEHTPFQSQGDFLEKVQLYSELFASQHLGEKSSLSKAFFRGFWAFFRSYFLQRGIFYGEIGWTISFYKGLSSYYKYIKLSEKNRLSYVFLKHKKSTPSQIKERKTQEQ